MMYTEAEIREWFKKMRETYKNCPLNQHLLQVEHLMFEPMLEEESLENFKKGLDKSPKA